MTVTRSHVGAVCVLTLDRDARNALDSRTLASLLDALADAVESPGARTVVIAGGPAFSVGADLREDLDEAGQVRRFELFGQVFEAVATCPLPTVAAIAGHCIGGGAEIAAACDLRVADSTATFRFPGAAMGVPVGAAKLVSLVGLGHARDLLLTTRTIDAAQAQRIGLIQRVVEPGEARSAALDVAGQIAAHDPEAVAYLRRQLARFSGVHDHVAAENDAILALAEAGGDYGALTTTPGVGAWTGG